MRCFALSALRRPSGWRLLCATLLLSSSSFAADIRVGMVIMNREFPFWAAIERSAQQAAHANGVELIVKAVPTQNSDLEARLVAGLAAQPLDAIIVAPIDASSLTSSLKTLAAKGVKIVALRYPLPANLASTVVELDETAISHAGAEMLATTTSDNDEVAIFRSADRANAGGLAPRDRDAIAAVRAEHPKATIDADIFVGEVGQEAQQIDALLTTHPHVSVIYTSRPFFTNAVRDALKAKNLAGKIKHVAIGVGLPASVIDDLDRGVLAGWVGEESGELGRKAVEAAAGIIRGQSVPAVVTASFVAVTAKTAHSATIAAQIEN